MAPRHWIASLAIVAALAVPTLAQDNNRRRQRDNQGQSQPSPQTERGRREQSQARSKEAGWVIESNTTKEGDSHAESIDGSGGGSRP